MRRLRWAVVAALLATLLAVPARAQEADPPPEEAQRFLVQVAVPAEPEPTLPPGGVAEQRADIADAQADVEASLDDGTVLRDFTTVPYTLVEATPGEVAQLEDEGLISTAAPDIRLQTQTDVSRVMIGAPDVWPDGDGAGQTIAVLDTGTRINHNFFTGRIVREACFADDEAQVAGVGDCPNGLSSQTTALAAPADHPGQPCATEVNCNHGTHVAGIALGDDNVGDDNSGIAPGASLMSVRVFHQVPGSGQASAWLSDVLAGLQFAYTNRTSVNPDLGVVNISLGAGLFSGTCNNFDAGATRAAVANLTAAGIPVVAASGNGSSTSQIGFPACVTDVISVGSVNTAKNGASNADKVAGSSNASPSLDLLAPGQPITSANEDGGVNATISMNGTSMAAPHVAGAIALLRDARAADLPPPAERVHWLHGMLDATGVCINDPGNNITYRRIQVDAANEFDGPPSALFDDVEPCVWYEEAVNWLIDAGLATGYGDNTFRGETEITRAAVANMLWNLFGAPDVAHEHTFTDGAAWVEDALDWISDPAGPASPDPLAAGYDNGTLFRPNADITRGEVTRMLYRAAGSPDVTGLPQPFSDVPNWLDDAVRWAADDPDDGGALEPIVTGYGDGTFRQQNPITRAAVARMLQRFDASVDT